MDIFRRKKLEDNNNVTLANLSPMKHINREPRKQIKLEDFRIMTTLGTGTFGRVRLVQSLETGEYFALKILKKSEILRLQQFHHIKCEILILSSIRHPFIVNYINHFQDDKRLYVLLEYIQGGELFSYLRHEGRLGDDIAKAYTAQLVLALSYLHSMDIIYRDLKPENLLITKNGYLMITDFGFAKQVQERTWTLCGTPEYLAPEIIQSKGHGKSVDWWALGILLFEMLAGYPPFYDENPFGIYQKILKGKIDFPRHIDSKAKDFIKRLLCHDRTKRLGCLRGGPEDVKNHKYLAKIDWVGYYNQQYVMPYIPSVTGPGDHRHFDEYPDSPTDTALEILNHDNEAFREFDKF